MSLLFVIHLFVTLFLLGLIWVVQIVQYPLFKEIPEKSFPEYESDYQVKITYLVMPTMICELVTGIMLLVLDSVHLTRTIQISNLLMIIITWISTAMIQVPCHKRLLEAFNSDVHRRLVRSNWIRTLVWTARSLMLINVLLADLDISHQ
jgi:hypothetical protein